MTLQQLKYVIMAASSGTISKAAEALYITQPSLTASIKKDEIGILYFNHFNENVLRRLFQDKDLHTKRSRCHDSGPFCLHLFNFLVLII